MSPVLRLTIRDASLNEARRASVQILCVRGRLSGRGFSG
jgi:hypothetical protein